MTKIELLSQPKPQAKPKRGIAKKTIAASSSSAKKTRTPSLINRSAKSEVKTPKATSKTGICLRLCRRESGATLDEIGKALSKSGSAVSAGYARSWVSFLHTDLGFGLRSEVDDRARLRVWAFTQDDAPKAKQPATKRSTPDAVVTSVEGAETKEPPAAPAAS